MPPREISPAPLPTPTHSYQLEIGSIIGSLASDQRPGYDFFYFITFGHRLLATIIKNGGHDSDFIYLPLTTSIDMPHILRSKPASNTSGRTLSHGGCYHLSHVEQESNFPCISFFFASPSCYSARYSNHCFFSRRQRWGMMMRSVLSPQTNPNCSI